MSKYCLLALTLTACAVDDDPTYTRTIVRVADDGTTSIEQEPITAAEQRAEHEEAMETAANPPLTRTLARTTCGDWNATKFFDQPNYTGNELCLIGYGNLWLSETCRILRWPGGCSATWLASVRSLWTGQNFVAITLQDAWGLECADNLEAYEARATAPYCFAHGDQVLTAAP